MGTKQKPTIGQPVINGMRICNGCGINKSVSEYYADRTKAYGIRPECKKCLGHKLSVAYWKDNGRRVKKSNQAKNKRINDVEWAKNEREKRREWYRRNPDKGKEGNLKAVWGISLDQFNELKNNQGGKCAICMEIPKSDKHFHVDHNHITGEIRGLLCSNCNVGFGNFKENEQILRNAINYINNYPQSNKTKLYAKSKNRQRPESN